MITLQIHTQTQTMYIVYIIQLDLISDKMAVRLSPDPDWKLDHVSKTDHLTFRQFRRGQVHFWMFTVPITIRLKT
jgi:hypothetical protein